MQDYAKVFASILHSSLWEEAASVRIVFLTMLLLRDLDDVVLCTPSSLARAANLPPTHVQRALKVLSSPDPASRSPELDGKRIVKVRGGWRVVNGSYYRNLLSVEDKRERTRERVARWRDKQRNAPVTPVTPVTTGEERRGEERKGEGGEPPSPPAPPRFPHHCPEHADVEFPPKCGACKERREAAKRSGGSGKSVGPPPPAAKPDCPECKGSGYRDSKRKLWNGSEVETMEPCPCRDSAPPSPQREEARPC